MTRYGYFLSSEEYDPASLIEQARMAERAGFDALTEDMVSAPCGPDPGPYIEAIQAYQQAGFDEVYLGQVGGRLEGAFDFLATQVLP